MAGNTIGLGIIGGGGAFGRFIASALPLVSGLEMRAIAGTNETRTRQAAETLAVSRWTLNYHDLIADPAVDIVVVASPPHLHAEMALAAIRAGKAAFIEKPLATTIDDGLLLLEESHRRNVPATIDYVMRYSPLYRAARQIVEAKLLGALRRMDFRNDAGDEGLADDHWFWDRTKSGGIFVEHGVHFFDVYGWLAGSVPLDVNGLALMRDATDKQDVVHADVRYENGVLGTYTHAFDKPSRLESQEGLLTFDRGSIRIHGWTPVRLDLSGMVTASERSQLGTIPGMQLDTVEQFPSGQTMRGRGERFTVEYLVRGTLTPHADSQELYRRAVGAALADLVATIRDPQHRQEVTLDDAMLSLAMACVAAGTAERGDLQRVVDVLRR
ncbi:MAG TPA: Gfo/Idh/MocA family oxidoreductase [Chloroflexota bacterium]